MSTTVIRPKSREEWLDIRKSGIGSSEVATIVGLNPFETPYQLWRRKRGIDPAQEETFAMKAGHYLEDAVAQFWHDQTGRDIIKRSAIDWIIRDNDKPFLQVSPDRTYWLGDKRAGNDKGILECKTTQLPVDGDDLPKHWFCQVQYQLGVAGFDHGSIAWLTGGREFGYRDIDLVPDFYAWLKEEAEKFYRDNILGGAEPSAVSVKDILLKYSRHTPGKAVETTDEIFSVYEDLKAVKKQLAELTDSKDALEEQIKVAFADAEALTYGGTTIATYKAPKPGDKLDAKAFAAAYPDLAEQFIQHDVQGSRRLLLK